MFIHPLSCSFIHPLSCSFINPLTCSFVHSPTHLIIHSFTHSPVHSFTHSAVHSFTHSPVHSFIHSPTHLFIHLLTHSFIPPLTHLFPHTLIHLLPPSPGVVEPVSRTCRRESPAWGDPGFLVLSAPRRRKHQAWGHVACSVHVRQAPRAARAAHSNAQVGTTRCPWRMERIHTTWSSSRGTGHGPGRDTAPPVHSHTPGATGHGARPRSPQSGPGRPTEASAEGWPPRTGR